MNESLERIKELTKGIIEKTDSDQHLVCELGLSLEAVLKPELPHGLKSLSQGEYETPYGWAISPYSASKCVYDHARTAAFIRGENQAILDLKKGANRPLNILYAGCGPLATLGIPIATQFEPGELY